MALERGQLLQQSFANAQNAFQQIRENKRQEELFKLQRDKMKAAADEARMQREALEQGVQGLQQAFATPIGAQQFTEAPDTEAPGGIGVEVQQAPPTAFTEQDQQQAVLEAGLNFLKSNQDDLGQKIVEQTLFPDPDRDPQALLAKLAKTQAETQRIQADTLNKRIKNEQAKIELGTSEKFVGARDELSDMLLAQAGEAENPTKKFQLETTGRLLGSAQSGKQMADILDSRFPSIESASSAMQALLRNGLEPLEAFQILQREEAKAKGDEIRDFGHDREAQALIMYDKAFAELSSAQKAQVESVVQDQRIAAQEEKVGRLPLDRMDRDKIGVYLDVRDLANKAISLVTPELVGRLNAPWSRLKERFGEADPEFTALDTTLNEIVDIIARDRTGAVIGENEQKFYSQLLGGITDNPKTLVNRLTELIERSTNRANRIQQLAITPGSQVTERFGLESLSPPDPQSTQAPEPEPVPEPEPDTKPKISTFKPNENLSPEQKQLGIDVVNELVPDALKP